MRVLGVFENWAGKCVFEKANVILVATDKLVRPGAQDGLS